jgi:hypothetical protein
MMDPDQGHDGKKRNHALPCPPNSDTDNDCQNLSPVNEAVKFYD